MRHLNPAALVLAALVAASPAAAAPLFPSPQGTIWHYVTPSGQHDDLVAGPDLPELVTVGPHQYLARTFTFAPGSVHAGRSVLLEISDDGMIRLVGQSSAGVGALYDPTILLLPTPSFYMEFMGGQTLGAQTYPTPIGLPTFIFYLLMLDQREVTVPAGTYSAVVGDLFSVFALGETNPGEFDDAWVAGVGLVRYHDGEMFELVSVTAPTPAPLRSWGELKRRYR